MTARWPITAAVLLTFAVLCVPRSANAQSSRELRERAADLVYNLDHAEAIRLLRKAVAAALSQLDGQAGEELVATVLGDPDRLLHLGTRDAAGLSAASSTIPSR